LSFDSDWNPPLGEPLERALRDHNESSALDIGCVASAGIFQRTTAGFTITAEKKPATSFLLELISRLQELGMASMIDVRAYAKWLRA
jgi:hypothetical protein